MTCKHCGLEITGGAAGAVHTEGPQRGLHRCALEPYGFNAEPASQNCGWTCWGWEPLPCHLCTHPVAKHNLQPGDAPCGDCGCLAHYPAHPPIAAPSREADQ